MCGSSRRIYRKGVTEGVLDATNFSCKMHGRDAKLYYVWITGVSVAKIPIVCLYSND